MGFSLENIIDDSTPYSAPDRAFMNAISGMVHSFPWERFERFFEARPLTQSSAIDQVFLLRVLAIQELLCMDDENVLKWLKSQMYLFAFLSPGFKPKVPTQALLNNFRDKLRDADLLEPFRQRCQEVILKQGSKPSGNASDTKEAFVPIPDDFSPHHFKSGNNRSVVDFEDKWVICPKCDSSALSKVVSGSSGGIPQTSCNQCGHEFKV